MKVEEKLIAD